MKIQPYTLNYINVHGDIIARDYFANEREARVFMTNLANSYANDGTENVAALELVDVNDKVIEYYETGLDESELEDEDE